VAIPTQILPPTGSPQMPNTPGFNCYQVLGRFEPLLPPPLSVIPLLLCSFAHLSGSRISNQLSQPPSVVPQVPPDDWSIGAVLVQPALPTLVTHLLTRPPTHRVLGLAIPRSISPVHHSYATVFYWLTTTCSSPIHPSPLPDTLLSSRLLTNSCHTAHLVPFLGGLLIG